MTSTATVGVAAAVEAVAITVRVAPSVEAVASAAIAAVATGLNSAAEVAAAVAVAAVEFAAAVAAIKAAPTVGIPATAIISAATIAISATVIAATAVVAMAVAVEPGAGTDENTADEPVRAIKAIGRAGIGRVVVVTVGADRGSAVICRCADANAEGHALGVRVGGGEETNPE